MNVQAISRFCTAAVMATFVLAITMARPATVSAQQSINHAAHEAQEDADRAAKAARDAEKDQQRAMAKAAHEAAEQQERSRCR
jgi:Ni/Co efflux regulator RcnB